MYEQRKHLLANTRSFYDTKKYMMGYTYIHYYNKIHLIHLFEVLIRSVRTQMGLCYGGQRQGSYSVARDWLAVGRKVRAKFDFSTKGRAVPIC